MSSRLPVSSHLFSYQNASKRTGGGRKKLLCMTRLWYSCPSGAAELAHPDFLANEGEITGRSHCSQQACAAFQLKPHKSLLGPELVWQVEDLGGLSAPWVQFGEAEEIKLKASGFLWNCFDKRLQIKKHYVTINMGKLSSSGGYWLKTHTYRPKTDLTERLFIAVFKKKMTIIWVNHLSAS